MATFKEIRGFTIKKYTTNPTNPLAGQMWYNNTTGTLKGRVSSGAWASSAPVNSTRLGTASTGTQTASLMMAGSSPPYPTPTALVEEYNGTGWTNETSLPASFMEGAGAGTTTAALIAGGFNAPPPPGNSTSFEYDGSTWTSGGALNNGRTNLGSGGTQAAALVYGGSEAPTPMRKATEEYDGTSWTSGNDMGNSRYQMMGNNVGLQTAALAIGGYSGGALDTVELYDGTNWTATTALPTAGGNQVRYGLSTAAVCAGGSPGPGANTDVKEFDGTTWTATPSLATARDSNSGSGTTTAGVIGAASPFLSNTEEYNVADTVIVPGAWASAPALNTGRNLGGSALPAQNSGIIFGGSPYTGATEQYDGSSWTTVPGSLNTPRGYISGFGTETAAVCAGGYNDTLPSGTSGMAEVEEYNGTSWSEETNLPSPMMNSGNCGTLTAGLLMGGSTAQPFAPNVVATALEYDGSTWPATPGNMATAKGQGMSGGTQTAAFYAGGRFTPAYTATTVEYNGSTFSAGGDLAFGAGPPSGYQGSIGTLTAGLAASGKPTTNDVNTYDGTSWFSSPAYTTSRNRGMSGGTQTAAIIAGGSSSSTATEEFTGETTAANIVTVTTS